MALKDLLKDSAKNNGSKSNKGGMERIEVTSDHTMIDEADTGSGCLLRGREAELARGPETVEQEDGTEIVELAEFEGDREAVDTPVDTVDISAKQARERSLFTEEEASAIEELEEEQRLSDSDKESIEKVEEALADPSLPNSRTELYYQLWNEEHGGEPKSKEEKVRELGKNRDWIQSPKDEIREKSLEEASLGELADLLDGETSEESELEQNPDLQEETGEQLSVPEIDEVTAEQAAAEWSQRGGVWEEFAQDMKNYTEIPNTHVTSINPDRKRIVTSFDKLIAELESLDSADVLEKDGDVMVAEVPAREEF